MSFSSFPEKHVCYHVTNCACLYPRDPTSMLSQIAHDQLTWVKLLSHPHYILYRTKLRRGENFGEFGKSPQFAKFFRQHSR